MKRFKHWKRYSLLSASTIVILSGSLVAYQIYQDYQSMQVLQIESFDSYWKNIYDEENKLVKEVTDQQLSELKSLIKTPNDKSRYRFAEVSSSLRRLTDSNSGYEVDKILSIMSEYQLDREVDKDFLEQRAKNLEILKKLEKFTNDLSDSLHSLTISEDQKQIIFDQTLTDHTDLPKIETEIKWSQIDKYNLMIDTLNSEIKSQISENKDYQKQKTVIDLKQNLDDFISLIESTKEKLKTRYISVKDIKSMIDKIKSIKDSNSDWLTDTSILSYSNTNEDKTSTISAKFYSDNNLNSMSSLADLISVKASIKSERLIVKNKSDESKSSKIIVKPSIDFSDLRDEDLIEIESLKILSFDFKIEQTEKIFKETTSLSSSSDSSSGSDSRASSSRATSSSERRR